MLTLFVRRSDLVIWIDSPIVCWLAAPFKKLPCIIAKLFYCLLSSRSIPFDINGGCSAGHFHLYNSVIARRNRQMRVLYVNWRINTYKLENVGKHYIWIVNLLIEPYDFDSLVRKVLPVCTDIFPVSAQIDNVWLFRTISFMEVFKNKKPGVVIHST